MMRTAILVPVLDRPHRVRPLVENIEAVTPEPHVILFAASDQETVDAIKDVASFHPSYPVVLLVDGGDTWPRRINKLYTLARNAEFCDHVFTGADDLLFHEYWLREALATMSTLPNSSGVVMVEDLHNPNGTAALITMDYVERFGGTADSEPGVVMHEGYAHNFSDTELLAVAKARGRHARAFPSVVEHLHPAANKGVDDETYAKGMSTEPEDRALFMQRRRLLAGVVRGDGDA